MTVSVGKEIAANKHIAILTVHVWISLLGPCLFLYLCLYLYLFFSNGKKNYKLNVTSPSSSVTHSPPPPPPFLPPVYIPFSSPVTYPFPLPVLVPVPISVPISVTVSLPIPFSLVPISMVIPMMSATTVSVS